MEKWKAFKMIRNTMDHTRWRNMIINIIWHGMSDLLQYFCSAYNIKNKYMHTLILWYTRRISFESVSHHGQWPNSSGMTMPRLENGTGRPSSKDSVGTKSVCATALSSFFKKKKKSNRQFWNKVSLNVHMTIF